MIRTRGIRLFFRGLLILLAVIISVLAVIAVSLHGEIKTILSLTDVQDGNLYTVNYSASYDLDSLLSSSVTSESALDSYFISSLSRGLVGSSFFGKTFNVYDFSCTSFAKKDVDGDMLFARNCDSDSAGAVVLTSSPENGYRSISVCSPKSVSLDASGVSDIANTANVLALIYAPIEGMNEKGLAICQNRVSNHPTWQENQKTDILSATIVRLVLDKCATVDEAVRFLSGYDVHDALSPDTTDHSTSYHYHVVDKGGTSAIIEFDYTNNYKLTVNYVKCANSTTSYQICSNHYAYPPLAYDGDDMSRTHERYQAISDMLEDSKLLGTHDCFDILKTARMEDVTCNDGVTRSTVWSTVYNLDKLTLSIGSDGDAKNVHTFSIE
ncbi:MAG: linear amide C-N hydrolase [Clostridia bacterium]|nr:linear amide C-N hydrolase [Clostridia bacterium]